MRLIVLEFSFVLSAVRESLFTPAMKLSCVPVSLVLEFIGRVSCIPMWDSILELTFAVCALRHAVDALTTDLAFFPLSLITTPRRGSEGPLALRESVLHVTFEHAPVLINTFAEAARLSFFELTNVFIPILVEKCPITTWNSIQQLPNVFFTRSQENFESLRAH